MSAAPEKDARAFVDRLAHRDWAGAAARFDPNMKARLSPAKLEADWVRLEDEAGAWASIDDVRVEAKDGLRSALVTGRFARHRRLIRVVFDGEERIAGLWFRPVVEDLEADARALIEALAHGNVTSASKDFDPKMRAALPPDQLDGVWKKVVAQAGAFVGVERTRVETAASFWTVFATCKFERASLVAKVSYSPRSEVAGLFFVPPEAALEWKPPSYAKLDRFEEVAVTVGKAPSLPGILSLPSGAGPFPGIVLVHGSGPNDADESAGAIKVFKDLAFGLASRGVAVLRYVKRSRLGSTGIVTQKEEVIDGAIAAIDVLRATPRVDPVRVFVAGHSQGGYLAPRIARESSVAGLVVLAGPTRPLQDSVIEQLEYLSSLDPASTRLKTEVDQAKQFKNAVEDPNLRPDQTIVPPHGSAVTGAYFLDVRDYHPEKVAAALSCPMLILQGGRDYQVTKIDFEAWQAALGKEPRVALRMYPSLNHLFVAGSGPPSPREYEHPGHVDEQVVTDIAAWISDSSARKNLR